MQNFKSFKFSALTQKSPNCAFPKTGKIVAPKLVRALVPHPSEGMGPVYLVSACAAELQRLAAKSDVWAALMVGQGLLMAYNRCFERCEDAAEEGGTPLAPGADGETVRWCVCDATGDVTDDATDGVIDDVTC